VKVVLVGPAAARARLHAQLDDASIEVVGEFPTLGSANAAGLDADGILMVPDASPADEDDAITEPLTAREIQVLELLAEGLPNKAIAAASAIRPSNSTSRRFLESSARRTAPMRSGAPSGEG